MNKGSSERDSQTLLERLRARFPRVAITHEWLVVPGGSEDVVLALLDIFPDADVYTSVFDPEPWPSVLRDRTVRVSFLDRSPGARSNYPRLLPLMDAAFQSFDLRGYDLVLSSNHACAKNVITAPGTLHACYCHTPMRYAWDPGFLVGEQMSRAEKLVMPFVLPWLRRQDAAAAARPDVYYANSRHVAARIAKWYRRSSTVIPPPVEIEPLIATPRQPGDYYVVLGRLVPYKRVDLAVAACTDLGRPLKVIGEGRALASLRRTAGRTVEFLGRLDDAEARTVLAGARALLFPGEEDFGIVPVEAQAAGVPVVAYGVGGVRDSVTEGVTGVFFREQTASALACAIEVAERQTWDEAAIRANARQFGVPEFRARLARALHQAHEVVPREDPRADPPQIGS